MEDELVSNTNGPRERTILHPSVTPDRLIGCKTQTQGSAGGPKVYEARSPARKQASLIGNCGAVCHPMNLLLA